MPHVPLFIRLTITKNNYWKSLLTQWSVAFECLGASVGHMVDCRSPALVQLTPPLSPVLGALDAYGSVP